MNIPLYPGNALFSRFRQVKSFVGGDVITLGDVRPNIPPVSPYRRYGLLMRVTKTGAVKWVKFIGRKNYCCESQTSPSACAITHNNEIVVVSEYYIFKFDSNGNLLWQKEVPTFSSTDLYEQVMETSDGGFLLGGVASSVGYVVKLNAAGVFVWSTSIRWDYSYANCRSLAESPSAYYLEGFSYTNDSSQNHIIKLDKSGNLLWSRSIGKATNTFGTEFAFDWMEYKNGKLVLTGNTNDNYRGPLKSSQAVLVVDEAGSLASFTKIENNSVKVQTSGLFRSRLFNYESAIGVQTFDSTFNDVYVYQLPRGLSRGYAWKLPIVSGRKDVVDLEVLPDSTSMIAGTASIFAPNYTVAAFLIKTDAQGAVGNCSRLPFTYAVSSPAISFEPTVMSTYLSTNYYYHTIDTLEVFTGTGFNWDISCSNNSVCRMGKIQGPGTICAGTGAIYAANRDPNCQNKITYTSTDTSVVITPLSDSTANIIFKQSGRVVIYGRMQSGCGTLQDSVVITSLASPGNVNLGDDTTICQGNSLVLHAGIGYVNYLWQDHSSDSIFSATKPGKYYVTVSDACGNNFSDTIFITADTVISVNAGADRVKCNNDTVHLQAPVGYISYSWSPAYNINTTTAQQVVVNPLVDTAYYLQVQKKPGCYAYDTIQVLVKRSPTINLGADTGICAGKTIIADAATGFNSYKWNTGDTTRAVTIRQDGTYWVNALYSNGCTSRDTLKVTVYPLPIVSLNKDTALCEGSVRTLVAPAGFNTYLWQDGSTGTSYVVRNTGTYRLEVTGNKGCKGSETVLITTVLPAPKGFLGRDTLICSYESVLLSARGSYRSYLWSDGSTTPEITAKAGSLYTLTVTSEDNCIGRDSILVSAKTCETGFYIPTAFTPNGDKKNDEFRPKIYGNISSYEFYIINRFGQTVFATNDFTKGWNGSVSGMPQNSGTYIWMCKYRFGADEPVMRKGTVILIR